MEYIAITITLLNILLCFKGLKDSFKGKSLFIIWWLFLIYFAILFLIKFFTYSSHYLDWNRSTIDISEEIKLNSILFNFLTNIFVFIGQKFITKRPLNSDILLPSRIPKLLKQIIFIFGIISFGVLLRKLSDWNYYKLVSSGDFGGYSFVFVQVFLSMTVYFYLQKKWIGLIIIFLLSTTYVIFTSVRSIFAYSVISIIYIYIYQLYLNNKNLKSIITRAIIVFLIVGIIGSALILLRPNAIFKLPEEYLVEINYVVFNKQIDPLLFNSYRQYLIGFFTPVKNLFDLNITYPMTVPEFNSGVFIQSKTEAFNTEYLYHFPALFYNELYVSFSWIGIIGGFFYSSYFLILENFIKKTNLRLFLFLPLFSWHTYMIFRGATDISSSGICYALWIQILIYTFFFKHFKK